MFDFSIVTNWIHQTLTSVMPEGLAIFLECVVIGVCIILMYAVLSSNAASVRTVWVNGVAFKSFVTY